jgi:hypothetical protein
MSLRSSNQKKVNYKLMELNKEHIPKSLVILNTSPPRVGKTINSIFYFVDESVPLIVFVDNDKQTKDLYNKLLNINKKEDVSFYHWKSKAKLCFVLSNIDNEELFKDEKIRASFEIIKYKNDRGVSHCWNCKFSEKCQWNWQKKNMNKYDVILMNKHNIGTILIDNDKLFYKNDTKRAIVYDEEIDKLKITKYKKLYKTDIELLNKIITLTIPLIENLVNNNSDFINDRKQIKEIFKVRVSNEEIIRSDFDFSKYGELDKKVYIETLISKVKNNLEILDYLDNKNAPFPEINNKDDFREFTLEKLFVDVLIEKRGDHKIVLLDATPLELIINRIEDKVGDLKVIKVNPKFFNNDSLIFRISRKGNYINNSRMAMKTRIVNNIDSKKISQDNFGLEKDISYITAFKINEIIQEYNNLNNQKAEYGVVTYGTIRFKKKEIDIIEMLEKHNIKNILYYGNYRGRSNLNECDVTQIIGTDRHDASALYKLYRYLDGKKSLKELKKSYDEKKHVYDDVLFNSLVKHQKDSAMEQIIFRNMPHINKRLVIIEGYFPEHLKEYFQYILPLKIYEEFPNSGIIATPSKRILKEIINKFLDNIYNNKKLDSEFFSSISQSSCKPKNKINTELKKKDIEEARKEVMVLTRKYLSPKYKRKYNYTIAGVFDYLNEKHGFLMKKAKINSVQRFRKLYKN